MTVVIGPWARQRRASTTQKALLGCGIAYGAVYVVSNDLVAALLYDGYSRLDQAVSELSATGAPPQGFLRALLPVQAAMMGAFGVGVWRAARGRRAMRALAALLVAFGVTGLAWLPFPMSSRADLAVGATSANDVGHLVLAGTTVLLIVGSAGLGAAIRRGWFRTYSIATIGVVLVSGAITGVLSPRIPQGEPTPFLGLAERVSIGAWLSWMAVLAIVLMREGDRAHIASRGRGGRPGRPRPGDTLRPASVSPIDAAFRPVAKRTPATGLRRGRLPGRAGPA